MKKFLKNWTLFEKLFLVISLIVVTICFVVTYEKNYLSFVCSIIGTIMVMLVAKGLVISSVIGIVYSVLYSILSITQKYYGEAIIYIFLMIPSCIMILISWFKHRSKEDDSTVEVESVSKKECLIVMVATAVLFVGFYFLLKALDTNQLLISTISLITSLLGEYFLYRRNGNYAIFFILNDLILILLWGISSFENIEYLTTVVCFAIFLINDIYGFVNWKRLQRKQQQNNASNTAIIQTDDK